MGIVREEISHEDLPVSLAVVEREKGETTEPWRFIRLDVEHFERLTPPELRRLGRWLLQQGKRIGQEYKANGARKASAGEILAAQEEKTLRHMLGAEPGRYPKSKWGFRNYYCVGANNHGTLAQLRAMEVKGLLSQGRADETNIYFHATEAGCKALRFTKAQVDRAFDR